MDCGTASSRGLKICCRAVLAPPGVTAIAGNRLFVEAVIWKLRAGAPWRDLPERFGGWTTRTSAFRGGPKAAFGKSLFKALEDDPGNEYAMIDATIVRAHWHSAGARKKAASARPSALIPSAEGRAADSRPKSTRSLTLSAIRWRSASPAGRFTTSHRPKRSWLLSSPK